jgi:glycosyltransferase involved in cell wall biosynthesis
VARADHVLADSQSTRNDLNQLLQVPEDKVTVVYPGVDPRFKPSRSPEDRARVRSRYGIGGGPFILGVGTLEPRKNWPALIRAWARLRQRGFSHRLVIAGGIGWLYEETLLTAEASSHREDIVLPGFVDDADLPTLYAAADVFAFPSRYEGFGIPVVEAMACGTPVVCADNSSLPEAAGMAGLTVSSEDEEALADALHRLISDGELHARLTRLGLEHARRFTWETAARTLLATYERVGAYG